MNTAASTVASILTAATLSALCIGSAQADPYTAQEKKFIERMITGHPSGGAAPIVPNLAPGHDVSDLVKMGHAVVRSVRSGVNPYDTQSIVMRGNPGLTNRQAAWIVTSSLRLFDPAVASFYYDDLGTLPQGCWVIRQIDLKCSS